ncbi:hypothetical protein OG344_17015 [Microbispora sp. NBC_01389]
MSSSRSSETTSTPAPARAQAAGDLAQLPLAAARHPRDPDDLAGQHVERDIAQPEHPVVAVRAHPREGERGRTAGRRHGAVGGQRRHRPAHHRLHQFRVVVRRRVRPAVITRPPRSTVTRSAIALTCDVLCHGQRRDQPQFLEHHADPEGPGGGRAADPHRRAVHHQVARVGPVHAVDELEKGALARAVLPDEGVYLAGAYVEVDPVVGDDVAERPGQAAGREQGMVSGSLGQRHGACLG